jgi:hypothetical protein
MDPRIKDAVRRTEKKVDELTEKVDRLIELLEMNLTATRAIKDSVVRKYNRKSPVETVKDKITGKGNDES